MPKQHVTSKIFVLFSLFIAAAAAGASDSAAERAARFTLQPIEGGVLRLDTETGRMALCTRQATGVVCEEVGSPGGLSDEGERLAAENRALKAEIQRLEDLLAMDDGQRQARPRPRFELPSEEEVDKALGYMERMFKKFRDKLKDLDGGRGKGAEL